MMSDWQKIVTKTLFYLVSLLLFYSIQSALGRWLEIYGAKPDFLPFFVATTAMLEGYKGGALIGLAAGVLCDLSSPVFEGFFAFVYTFIGLGCGLLFGPLIRKIPLNAFFLGAISAVLLVALPYVVFFMPIKRVGLMIFARTAVPQIIYTCLLFPLPYFTVRWIKKRLVRIGADE